MRALRLALPCLALSACHRLDKAPRTDPAADSADATSSDSAADSRDSPPDTSPDSRDTAPDSPPDSQDSDTAPPIPMPWEAPGFWEDPGPLAPLMWPEEDELVYPGFELVYATSPDGQTWTSGGTIVIQHMSSIDLLVTPEGLIVLGLISGNSGFLNTPGTVYAISTQDLRTWGSHAWPVENLSHQNLVDPALHLTARGELALTYFSTDFIPGLDPVFFPGAHDVRAARWDGEAFVEEEPPIFSAEGLVDPNVCREPGSDDLLMFATQSADRVIVARSQDDGRSFVQEPWSWEGVTVPYCAPAGLGEIAAGEVEVLAQVPGQIAEPQWARYRAGEGFTVAGDVWAAPPWVLDRYTCTSPVMTEWQGGYLLICVEHRLTVPQ